MKLRYADELLRWRIGCANFPLFDILDISSSGGEWISNFTISPGRIIQNKERFVAMTRDKDLESKVRSQIYGGGDTLSSKATDGTVDAKRCRNLRL